jgi:glutamate-1-semialdehyde 2,1-aminomutase
MTTIDEAMASMATSDGWPVPTATSAALHARASRISPGGVQGEGRGATPYPLFMTQAQGGRIRDVDGNEFVDFHASFGAILLGHNDPRINVTVRRAMDEHGVSFSTANPLEVELAERLVDMIPSADRVVFSCTGTEATYHAIRLARAFTGRERILKFEGNYHGWHDYVAWSHHLATDEADVPTPIAASAGIPAGVRDLVVVREYNDAAAVRDVLAREVRRSPRSSSSPSSTTPVRCCPSRVSSRPSARRARRPARS